MDPNYCEGSAYCEGRIGPTGLHWLYKGQHFTADPQSAPSRQTLSWALIPLILSLGMLVVLVSVWSFLFRLLLLADLIYVGIKDTFHPKLNSLVIESYTLYGF